MKNATATYRNPWHNPHDATYGPATYETAARPVAVAGYLIYQRIKGAVWDVVKDGVCVSQRAGLRGATDCAETLAGISTADRFVMACREAAVESREVA